MCFPKSFVSSIEVPRDLGAEGRPKDLRHEPDRDKSVLLLGEGSGVRSDMDARKGEFRVELAAEAIEAMLDVDRFVRNEEVLTSAFGEARACCVSAVSETGVSKIVGVSLSRTVVGWFVSICKAGECWFGL